MYLRQNKNETTKYLVCISFTGFRNIWLVYKNNVVQRCYTFHGAEAVYVKYKESRTLFPYLKLNMQML